MSTPLPGETLAKFYARSSKLYGSVAHNISHKTYVSEEHWVKKAFSTTDDRGKEKGKMLRQLAFEMAKERYSTCSGPSLPAGRATHKSGVLDEYKPILKEVEKILGEAGLDEEEIKRSAAAGPMKASDQSRNRR